MDGYTESKIMLALGRIEGKINGICASMERQRNDHEQVEARVRALENWRWYVIGLFSLAVISAVVGFVVR